MLCKIWSFHGGDYEEFRLLGCKNLVRTSQETHNFSATESSQLMLCKIWGFHSSDYEECRLLRYKNPVRTSQETHNFSATESSQLMLCKIWGFHGSDYEKFRLLGCGAVWRHIPGWISRATDFDSLRHQIFWEVGLDRDSLGLVSLIEELLESSRHGSFASYW
jgi:hypothetical protein